MKEPKVELKSLKSFKGIEGYGFNVTVYINGQKAMFVMDGGNGGQYDYEVVKGQESNVQLLKDYVKSISEKDDDSNESMDMYIANKVDEYENKKIQIKLMKTAIVFGNPTSDEYQFIKQKLPLSKYPTSALQNWVNKIKLQHCIGNVQILNTNLKELGITI